MQKLSSIILFVFLFVNWAAGQTSPHGNLQIDCSECHTSTSWKISTGSASFNHETTGFSLMGQHKQVDCKQCHSSLKFSEARKECFTCHKDIHKNSVGQQCENCHTPQSWIIKNVNELHQKSRFPLLGNHATADCSQCHNLYRDLNFEPLGVKCYDCHKQNFNSAKTPDHIAAQFSTNCEDCHNLADKRWGFASFGHDFFPLKGGHAINNCLECHEVGNYKGLSKDCYTCHKTDFENTKEPNHVSSQFSHDCTECHTTNPGWKPASFDHSKTKFPITGAHTQVTNCADCHKTGYVNTPTDCFSCHKTNYENTTNPNHAQVNFQTTCEDCHTTKAWRPADFDHDNKFFPIYSGEHKGEWNKCTDCHTNTSNYADFSCINCHEHNQSKMNDEHKKVNGYVYQSQACYNCHPNGKEDGAFNHATTRFPLLGQHATTDCADCHKNNTYGNTSMLCESCHLTNFSASINPNHQQVGISTDCQTCHNSTAWKPSTFNHEAKFQLLGSHATTDCSNCHKGQTTGTSQICNDCHNQNFANSLNPNHQQVGISTDCQTCHNSTAWKPSTFNHEAKFQLLGSHATTDCANCHKGQTTGTSQICNDCHNQNFANSLNPNHQQVGISTDCQTCHNSTAWKPSTFNHDAKFQLLGTHATTDCANCHKGQTTGTSQICNDCHNQNFANSLNPNHQQVGISTDCQTCHNSTAWKPSTFNHEAKFQLLGSHATTDCANCHKGQTTGTSQICNDCHNQNFANSLNPNHQQVGISTDCQTCHNSTAWIPSNFNHGNTKFLLTGAHTTTDCSDCHKGVTTGTSSDCYSCHKSNFDAAVNPNHITGNFPTTCEVCHTTQPGWRPATFTNHDQFYVIQGAHAAFKNDCQKCHSAGYTNTPNTCFGCHEAKYNATTNPNHKTAAFPTDCESCHSQNAWKPATFDHDGKYFPIYSGEHKGEWNACSDCHTSSADYKIFSCIDCHEHSNKTKVDDDHKGVNGYSYVSSECYRCHPNGKDDGFKAIRLKRVEN